MDISKFPNPKINLPKKLRNKKGGAFSACILRVENYIILVGGYIYTDIDLNYGATDFLRTHAWVQRTVSASVLRSLYIRNSFVDAMNSQNHVALFLSLKAWFETVGFLASILDILKQNLSEKELSDRLLPFALGNRGKGSLRVGEIDAINVATMIEKADKYMRVIAKENGTKKEDLKNFFTDYYDLASNPSHPSFDAHEAVGSLDNTGVWHAKHPEETKEAISEDIPSYGGLLMAPIFTQKICDEIFEIEREHFRKLDSKKFFTSN